MYKYDKYDQNILNILLEAGINIDGTICLKTNSIEDVHKYLDILNTFDYCAFFGQIMNMTLIETKFGTILYIPMDTESG